MPHVVFAFSHGSSTARLLVVEVVRIVNFGGLLYGLGMNLPFQADKRENEPPNHNSRETQSPRFTHRYFFTDISLVKTAITIVLSARRHFRQYLQGKHIRDHSKCKNTTKNSDGSYI